MVMKMAMMSQSAAISTVVIFIPNLFRFEASKFSNSMTVEKKRIVSCRRVTAPQLLDLLLVKRTRLNISDNFGRTFRAQVECYTTTSCKMKLTRQSSAWVIAKVCFRPLRLLFLPLPLSLSLYLSVCVRV